MSSARYLDKAKTFIEATSPATLPALIAGHLKHGSRQTDALRLKGEDGSWTNSLPQLAAILDQAGLHNTWVALEYNPHQAGNSRADALIIGTKNGRPAIVVVELKQWSQATWDSELQRVSGFNAPWDEVEHPVRQANRYAMFLQNYTEGFTEEDATVTPVAFLHNATEDSIQSLRLAGNAEADQLFSGDTTGRTRFITFLHGALDPDDAHGAETVARSLDGAPYKQSPGLLKDLEAFITQSDQFPLSDEQANAKHAIEAAVQKTRDPLADRDQAVFVVKGGPGTGKTWICMHLLAAAARANYQATYATNSTALRSTLQSILRHSDRTRPIEGMIASARTFWDQKNWGSKDLIIVDEAQRLNQYTIRTGFGNAKRVQEELEAHDITQLFELKKSAKVLVLMLDEGQTTTAKDYATITHAQELATRVGATYDYFELTEQHRTGGSAAFEEWVDALVGGNPIRWKGDPNFTLEVATSPEDLEAKTMAKSIPGSGDSRLVAGFAWPWKKYPKAADIGRKVTIDDVPHDIEIGTWAKRWNLRTRTPATQHTPGTRRPDRYPDSDTWAHNPLGAEQMGSIFSAQGFEFPHVGVLFGRDFIARSGEMIVDLEASDNDALTRMGGAATERIRNQYRVLLTRAMNSVVLYSVDPETQALLQSLVHTEPDTPATTDSDTDEPLIPATQS